MASQYHLTPDGPGLCRADPTNPQSTGCKYTAGGHYGDIQQAEVAFSREFDGEIPEPNTRATDHSAQPGPPVPARFFHIARRADLDSIIATGLTPSIGDRSADLGEELPRVYLFDSLTSAEDGLGNWLADEFDEDEELVLISVDSSSVQEPTATYVYEDDEEESGFGPSTEWTSEGSIPGSMLKVEGPI